jgi:hypothetical protein
VLEKLPDSVRVSTAEAATFLNIDPRTISRYRNGYVYKRVKAIPGGEAGDVPVDPLQGFPVPSQNRNGTGARNAHLHWLMGDLRRYLRDGSATETDDGQKQERTTAKFAGRFDALSEEGTWLTRNGRIAGEIYSVPQDIFDAWAADPVNGPFELESLTLLDVMTGWLWEAVEARAAWDAVFKAYTDELKALAGEIEEASRASSRETTLNGMGPRKAKDPKEPFREA